MIIDPHSMLKYTYVSSFLSGDLNNSSTQKSHDKQQEDTKQAKNPSPVMTSSNRIQIAWPWC